MVVSVVCLFALVWLWFVLCCAVLFALGRVVVCLLLFCVGLLIRWLLGVFLRCICDFTAFVCLIWIVGCYVVFFGLRLICSGFWFWLFAGLVVC